MQLDLNERQTSDNKLLRIEYYSGYDFINKAGAVSYSICNYFEVVGYDANNRWVLRTDESEYFIAKPVIENGSVELDEQIVQQWGADDQLIFDYVANQLNIELI